MTFFKAASLGAWLAIAPVAGWAFDCSTSPNEIVAALPGTWSATNGAGVLTYGGRTMVLPAGNLGSGEIVAQGDGLAAKDWNVPGLYPAKIVTDARFVLDTSGSRVLEGGEEFYGPLPQFMSGDEVRLMAGCKEGEISPQIMFSGVFQDDEGPVEFEVYLFAITKDVLYGVTSGKLKSMGGHAKRITRWVRVN